MALYKCVDCHVQLRRYVTWTPNISLVHKLSHSLLAGCWNPSYSFGSGSSFMGPSAFRTGHQPLYWRHTRSFKISALWKYNSIVIILLDEKNNMATPNEPNEQNTCKFLRTKDFQPLITPTCWQRTVLCHPNHHVMVESTGSHRLIHNVGSTVVGNLAARSEKSNKKNDQKLFQLQ